MMNLYNPDGSVTKEFSMHRLQNRYRFLFPIKLGKEELLHVFTPLSDHDPHQDILVVSGTNYAKPTFLGLLLRMQQYIELKYFDLFSLTELWLGKDEEVASISQVTHKHIAISFSHSELPNKNHQDVLLYVLDNQIRPLGSTRWLFFNGSMVELKQLYPAVFAYFNERKFPVVHIPPFTGKRPKTEMKASGDSSLGKYF